MHGATREAAGSCFLVDCGLVQGGREAPAAWLAGSGARAWRDRALARLPGTAAMNLAPTDVDPVTWADEAEEIVAALERFHAGRMPEDASQ